MFEKWVCSFTVYIKMFVTAVELSVVFYLNPQSHLYPPNQNGTIAKDGCCKEKFISAECVRFISCPDKKCGKNFQWVTSSALSAHTD